MMRYILAGMAAFAAAFLIAHFLIVSSLPDQIMSKVRSQMISNGVQVHAWTMSPRVTPESQTVVRPSPDLAYSVCLIDASRGPVELSVPAWPDYGSLSIFAADTENIYVGSLDSRIEGAKDVRRVVIALEQHDATGFGQADVVRIRKPEALALIRRLAPTQAAHEAAAALIPVSICAPL